MKRLVLACALGVSAAVAGGYLMGPVSAQPWAGGDFRGLPDGSWRESCRYPQSRGSYLSAECRTSYDSWVQTQINVNNCRSGRVGNSDGRLVCENQGGGWYPGGGWNLPGGSWRQTCRYPVMRGSYLSAQCPTMGDRWTNATIDVRQCRGRDISNQNGQLYCDSRGPGWGGQQRRRLEWGWLERRPLSRRILAGNLPRWRSARQHLLRPVPQRRRILERIEHRPA